jgi:hypothetical protein
MLLMKKRQARRIVRIRSETGCENGTAEDDVCGFWTSLPDFRLILPIPGQKEALLTFHFERT